MSDRTEASLLERLRNGSDSVAWDDFFQRYWRLIYALARQRGCSDPTAQDIVQDVMLAVFEKRDVFQYDPARGRFRDWIAAVVRNMVGWRQRRPDVRLKARETGSFDPVAVACDRGQSPESIHEAAFEETLLVALLDVVRHEVSPRTYQAFELSAIDGVPGAQVATILGISRNAVYLARRKVRKRLIALGAPYRNQGELQERLKRAMQAGPEPTVERALTQRVEESLRSR